MTNKTNPIYRVRATCYRANNGDLIPTGERFYTHYCGTDREAARVCFHGLDWADKIAEVILDAGTEDFDDDDAVVQVAP